MKPGKCPECKGTINKSFLKTTCGECLIELKDSFAISVIKFLVRAIFFIFVISIAIEETPIIINKTVENTEYVLFWYYLKLVIFAQVSAYVINYFISKFFPKYVSK